MKHGLGGKATHLRIPDWMAPGVGGFGGYQLSPGVLDSMLGQVPKLFR